MEILEQKIADLRTTPGARASAQAELADLQATAKPGSPTVSAIIEPEDEAEADEE